MTPTISLVLFLSTPVVCPDGTFQFAREVALASARQGVTEQLTVRVMPNGDAPHGIDSKGFAGEPAAAWVNTAHEWDSTIYVRYDVLHAMQCGAYRLIATHEVCHISLKHVEKSAVNDVDQANRELAAWNCTKSFFSKQAFEKAYDEFVSALFLTKTEKIHPPNQSYYFYRGRMKVPQYLYSHLLGKP